MTLSAGCSAHTISVYSDPDGAQVLVDGNSTGMTTPAEIRVKDLDYGSHKISVAKEGFEMSGPPQELRIAFREGLAVSSVLFFYTPFPWIRVAQTGYKGVTYPRERTIPMFRLQEIEASMSGPLELQAALRVVADDLFTQVDNRRGESSRGPIVTLVADPVIDSNTGEVTNVSRRIQDGLDAEARRSFPHFVLSEIDSQNIDRAQYVITGIIPLETYRYGEKKLRHLWLSAFERTTGRIIAHSDVWIATSNLDFESTPMYRDSPMYLKDQRVEALIATARGTAGSLADKEYFDSLDTGALLNEATKAYDQGDYRLALKLFAQAAERDDGKVMRTYSGLYQSFFKLKQTKDAEEAFAILAKLGMRSGNLGVKFLFNVDATALFGSPEDLLQYEIWLRQIAFTIVAARNCVQIVGHASRSGTAEHNLVLSLRRAELVRSRMETEASGVEEKATAIGRGSEENIIGTGSNDSTDAIDRRVEFKLTRCGT